MLCQQAEFSSMNIAVKGGDTHQGIMPGPYITNHSKFSFITINDLSYSYVLWTESNIKLF